MKAWFPQLKAIAQQLRDDPKPLRFAILGAMGCLAGALVGELLLAVTRSPAPAPASQAVCLLIDCSGSMLHGGRSGGFGQKLQEVKTAARQFVGRQTLTRDFLAVVGFGSAVHVQARLSGDERELSRAIDSLYDGGGTAMDLALTAAAAELEQPPKQLADRSVLRSILLFTDGQPDNQSSALEAAAACRAKNIKIVAIGTGDADNDYLARITGDPALVFRATAGNFDESFQQAEKALFRSLVESSPTGLGLLPSVLQLAAWTALLALGVSLALIGGQNLYLHRSVLTPREAILGTLGGLGAGAVGGIVGQALFLLAVALTGSPGPETTSTLTLAILPLGRIVGWTILGALVGRGLALFVPNLDPRRAWLGGGLGGGAAAVSFLVISLAGDLPGRLVGAAILGAFLGVMIALIEAAFRQWWLEVRYGQKEVVKVSLGPTPVRIGSNSRNCTVWAQDARPLALQYQLCENQVVCVDYATETSTVVKPGEERVVGNVTVTVRAATAPAEGPAASSSVATPALRPVAPPPPPIKRKPGP